MTGTVLVIEHEADAGLDLMAGPFGADLRVLRPYLGDPLPEPGEAAQARYAGLIVLGGEMGAWDDEVAPWLPATRRLMLDAVREELPTLGICLGGQLLAAACGGVVERGPAGLELGLVLVRPLPNVQSDPFFGRVERAIAVRQPGSAAEPPGSWAVHQYHQDAVTGLPADAELLVTGDRYPHQGFRVGPAAWGLQYHPEVSTRGFAEWVDSAQRKGELTDDVAADVLGPIRRAQAAQRRLASVHALAFLGVLTRSVVREGSYKQRL
jgi:GMP synthase (glutamine-hydrolysing)